MNEFISLEDGIITFERRFSSWLRLFLLPWALPCIPLVSLYFDSAHGIDRASPPILGMVLSTLGLLLGPLALSGLLIGFALLGASIRLRLDPRLGEAILERTSPFRRRVTRYPLAEVEIADVALEAHDPANDAAIVTLRMPDGRKVRMGCFYRDEDAKDWVERIERAIDRQPDPESRARPSIGCLAP